MREERYGCCGIIIIQGDHSLAMQILKHEWHKIKEEDKSKVRKKISNSCTEVISLFLLFPLAPFITYDTPNGQLFSNHW